MTPRRAPWRPAGVLRRRAPGTAPGVAGPGIATAWRIPLLALSLAVTGYAGVRLLAEDPLGVTLWWVGAALLHDLVALPLYSALDRLTARVTRTRTPLGRRLWGTRGWVNHVRVPALLSGLLLLVWAPLIVGPATRYQEVTGLSAEVYGRRWLTVTLALFLCSGLWWAVRCALTARAGDEETDTPG
ncbi:hypothetical protein [Streptomyces sp. NPDC005438]|uniref:hypothetical protein n=1 Tax=Streptomyces sp. NPDC005438 TaxID=3156880 RepID=UPI0033B1A788